MECLIFGAAALSAAEDKISRAVAVAVKCNFGDGEPAALRLCLGFESVLRRKLACYVYQIGKYISSFLVHLQAPPVEDLCF